MRSLMSPAENQTPQGRRNSKMAREISNSEDVIDSREVIKRIEELEEQEERDESEEDELKALKSLADEASGYAADWQYGETLIRDSYFKEYAQELADDIGAVNSNAGWPNSCIDWDEAARQLQQDYTEVDFDGVSYWIR
jgi:hypothetical protein